MGLAVVTVASGGLPVVESTIGGTPVTEAANGRGVAVTKVAARGMPVVFETIGMGGGGSTFATLDAATATAATLSGGNLVVTSTGTTSADQGAHVANTSGKTSGKYYFEVTLTTLTAGPNRAVGIGTTASTYSTLGVAQQFGCIMQMNGNIFTLAEGGFAALGARSAGNVIGIAPDLDNRRVWFRVSPAGTWNASGTANPATNVGGATIPAGTLVPYCVFGGAGGTAGNVFTMNLGASAFVGAVPAGFTSGWPA